MYLQNYFKNHQAHIDRGNIGSRIPNKIGVMPKLPNMLYFLVNIIYHPDIILFTPNVTYKSMI